MTPKGQKALLEWSPLWGKIGRQDTLTHDLSAEDGWPTRRFLCCRDRRSARCNANVALYATTVVCPSKNWIKVRLNRIFFALSIRSRSFAWLWFCQNRTIRGFSDQRTSRIWKKRVGNSRVSNTTTVIKSKRHNFYWFTNGHYSENNQSGEKSF